MNFCGICCWVIFPDFLHNSIPVVEKGCFLGGFCEAALDAFTAAVGDALKGGDKIQLVGFGTFEVRERAARTGLNPQTKETIEIPASKAPAFKPGKALKDAIQ